MWPGVVVLALFVHVRLVMALKGPVGAVHGSILYLVLVPGMALEHGPVGYPCYTTPGTPPSVMVYLEHAAMPGTGSKCAMGSKLTSNRAGIHPFDDLSETIYLLA